MNYFVPFLIAVFVNVVTGFYFYHRGKKDSDKGEKRLLSEIGKMLHDRGLKVTLVEEKPVEEDGNQLNDKSENAGDAAENDEAGEAKMADDTEATDNAEDADKPKD